MMKNNNFPKRYGCLLFDLDGTLIDSRSDLVTSVNLMLKELGGEPLPSQDVISFVGEGLLGLVERALCMSLSRAATLEDIRLASKRFSYYYSAHLLDQTTLYPGVSEVLESFHHLPKAVITNKPHNFAIRILERLGVKPHFRVVLGGDSLRDRKPSAGPLFEAARLCGSDPKECLMIGDSSVDVLAGQAAHMKTCGFVGGFRGREELEQAGADHLIERFVELLGIVD